MLGISHHGQGPSHTDWWLGTSRTISTAPCYQTSSLTAPANHPQWKMLAFTSAVIHWSVLTKFAERFHHLLSVHGIPTCPCNPSLRSPESHGCCPSPALPKNSTAESLHLKKSWHTTAAFLFVPISSSFHSYYRDLVNGDRQIHFSFFLIKKQSFKDWWFVNVFEQCITNHFSMLPGPLKKIETWENTWYVLIFYYIFLIGWQVSQSWDFIRAGSLWI